MGRPDHILGAATGEPPGGLRGEICPRAVKPGGTSSGPAVRRTRTEG
ncbi:hypothetical protein CZ771_06740 [Actinomycetales bacterium JB111]|nr:hypothetical protein CZ771_06740 [Actinomycetales bacterium JB111]